MQTLRAAREVFHLEDCPQKFKKMHGEMVVGGLVAFSLMKKVAAYGIARYYGFPKLYRKIIHANRRILASPDQAKAMNERVKTIFRLPNQAGDGLRNLLRATRDRLEGRPSS